MTTQSQKVSDKDMKKTAKPVADDGKKKVEKKEKKEKKVEVEKESVTVPPVPDTSSSDTLEDDSESRKRVPPTKDSVMEAFDDIIKTIESEIESLRESDAKTKGVKFLRTLNKRLKILKNQSSRIIKQKRTSSKKTTNNNSGFLKPVRISKEMAKFTGFDEAELKSRVDITKYICQYIKNNNLQNPEDKRQILADAKLSKLLKYDVKKEGEPLTYYKVQTCLKNHFIKTDESSAVAVKA
jgi:chromatin remodeling complex protein RSC6